MLSSCFRRIVLDLAAFDDSLLIFNLHSQLISNTQGFFSRRICRPHVVEHWTFLLIGGD